jgi:hypothetical protein
MKTEKGEKVEDFPLPCGEDFKAGQMCAVKAREGRKQSKRGTQAKQERDWSGRMQKEDGPGSLGWRCGQNGVIAVGMATANDLRSGTFVDTQTLAAESDATVGFDARGRALAPDVRPPRAAWRWT